MPKNVSRHRNDVFVANNTVTTAGTIAATQSGTWTSQSGTAATATLSNVSGSASSVTLLSLNTSRKQAVIYNDSTSVLYVKFGTTASTSSFTVLMQAGDYYELPVPVYSGRIDGIWASATGAARITELT